ncbi:variable large family protein [Borreliella turdi]|uniref:variable large family protein n=1 Tax=Borreliella turdi TaxID=57863 RepID=UPI001246132B|nr:variable large family protein [Borreliella turdi]
MKKISSVIFIATFLVFINCKNNTGEASNKDDPANAFYQSIIKLGNGFLDVFTSFGGLVAEAFGLKPDPKKSDVKEYFTSMAKKLEETKESLAKLPKENDNDANQPSKDNNANNSDNAVDEAIKGVGELLEKLIVAVKGAEKGSEKAGGDNIGTVVDSNAAVKADAGNVKEIAKGIKAIVDAAVDGGKGSVKLDAQAASGATNADAGKLFGKNAVNGAEVEDANKAAAAVNAVSGMQILKVIVDDADKGTAGAAANTANNIVDAAIGDDANAVGFGGNMDKDDKIAAAIVLRGMAKNGKFAVKSGGEKDKTEGTLKSAVASATSKTLLALSGLVQQAVKTGLDGAIQAVKGASSKVPAKANN